MSQGIETLEGEAPIDDLDDGGMMGNRVVRGGIIIALGFLALIVLTVGATGVLGGEDTGEVVIEEKGEAVSSVGKRTFEVNRRRPENSGPVFITEEVDISNQNEGEVSIVRASDTVDQGEVLPKDEVNVIPDITSLLNKPASVEEVVLANYEEDDLPLILPDKSQSSILVASNINGSESGSGIDVNSTDPQVIMRNLQALQETEEIPANFREEDSSRDLQVINGGSGSRAQTTRELGTSINNGSSAARLATRRTNPFVLSRGAYIDCVLRTQLNTQLAGLSTCQVLHNVYSDNGDVLLIERGSVVTGQYQTVRRQGINRVLVRWMQIRTPQDVLIDIDSPATDPVGSTGIPGILDNQFLKRFGGALLLSIVFDAKDAVFENSPRIDVDDGQRTNDTSEQIIEAILTLYADIQPTIEVDRGTRIGILVARDLDFEGVYELRAK